MYSAARLPLRNGSSPKHSKFRPPSGFLAQHIVGARRTCADLVLDSLQRRRPRSRWLIYQDRLDEAKAILVKYHGNGDEHSTVVALEYEEILRTLQHEKTVQKTDLKPLVGTRPNRWRLGITAAVAGMCSLDPYPLTRLESSGVRRLIYNR